MQNLKYSNKNLRIFIIIVFIYLLTRLKINLLNKM
jgi:hypothetical protein